MRYIIRDLKANKGYYLIFIFSFIILSISISLSISSFNDYYDKMFGNMVGDFRYTYGVTINNINENDLNIVDTLAQNQLKETSIITPIIFDKSNDGEDIFKIYLFNSNYWAPDVIKGERINTGRKDEIVTVNKAYKVGDYIQLGSQKYKIIGKIDSNKFDHSKYAYFPFDLNIENLGKTYFKEKKLELLISSNKNLDSSMDILETKLLEGNENLKIDIINKKMKFIKEMFTENNRFLSRTASSLQLVVISCINLILFILFWSNNKRKEMHLRKILGASNFNLFFSDLTKSIICGIIASIIGILIQWLIKAIGVEVSSIPLQITANNIYGLIISSIVISVLILSVPYMKGSTKNISTILKG